MKAQDYLLPVAAVLLVPIAALAQNPPEPNSIDTSNLKMGVGTTQPSAVTSVSSTKGDAKDEAQTDLDDKGDVVLYYKGDKKKSLALSAEQKQEIFEALSQLMDEAEAKKKTVTKDVALKHKFAGIFGQNVHAHLCATTAEIHNSYPNEVCAGNLLRVSWANTQTTKATKETAPDSSKPIPGHYTSDMFPPNDSAIVEGSPYANALDQQVAEVVAEVNKGATLTGINIFSSASTLRNTGGAQDQSHLQLSRQRAENAFAYVAKKLGEQGINVDATLTADKEGAEADSEGNGVATLDFGGGESCNGTTGANPPANYKWTADLDKNVPGTPAATLDAQGKAGVAAEYNKYQYVDVSFETLAKVEPSESVETSKAEQDFYASVGVAGEYREKGPPFRPLGFLRNIHGPSSHKNWGSTACPTF